MGCEKVQNSSDDPKVIMKRKGHARLKTCLFTFDII